MNTFDGACRFAGKLLVPFLKNKLVVYRSRSDAFGKGAENAKSIVVLYAHNFLACLAS